MMSYKIQTTDQFEEHFKKFSETKLFASLEKEFEVKPYYLKYRLHYWLTLVSSCLFNAFSALTASTLVLFFLKEMIHPGFALAIAIVFLLLLEAAKRLTLKSFFHDLFQFGKMRYGLMALIVILMVLSVCFSYFGARKTILAYTPPPVLTQDSLIQAKDSRIAEIKTEVETLEKNTNKDGVILWPSQNAIDKLNDERVTLQKEIARLQERQDGKNDNTEAIHKTETKFKAHHFGLITWCSELFFIFLGAYPRYYRFRSYAEFSDLGQRQDETPTSTSVREHVTTTSAGPKSDSAGLNQAQPLKTKELRAENFAQPTIIENTHVYPILDLTKTIKACRNSFKAAKVSAKKETRDENWDKYLEAKAKLGEVGYQVDETGETSLKIYRNET